MVSYTSMFVAAAAALPAAYAHIGAFPPSALDFDGDGYSSATPLAEKSFDEWWFHGNMGKENRDAAPTELQVGGSVTIPLGCNKESALAPGPADPCPPDTPSMHAGTPVKDEQLRGCGLAIAYKSEYADVKPEDFTVFSVNHDCVKINTTPFEIPANMPACEGDSCICAWFWQGQESANEMYMTGFRCTVSGGTPGATLAPPQPPAYCPDGGCVSGPKQPMYWANDQSNIDFSGDYDKKPAYNDNWGYPNGPQDIGMNGGSGETTTPTTPVEEEEQVETPEESEVPETTTPVEEEEEEEVPTPEEPEVPETTPAPEEEEEDVEVQPVPTTMITRTRGSGRPRPTPAAGKCNWEGHCEGSPCGSWNDCTDDLVCISGKCGVRVEGVAFN